MRRKRPLALFFSCAILTLGCVGGDTNDIPPMKVIAGGSPDTGHLSVGKLESPMFGLCTATLIGVQTVLTAAHCVEESGTYTFILQNEVFEVPYENITIHPGYQGWGQTVVLNEEHYNHDIAVLRLPTPAVTTPSPITQVPPTIGLLITLVGYGRTELGTIGQKFKTRNRISAVSEWRFRYGGESTQGGGTCGGDSGGPTFVTVGELEVQVGVHSFARCQFEVPDGEDVRVDKHVGWIQQNGGHDVLVDTSPMPDPLLDGAPLGAPCMYGYECDSGICAIEEGTNRTFCTRECMPDGALCPGNSYCVETSIPETYLCYYDEPFASDAGTYWGSDSGGGTLDGGGWQYPDSGGWQYPDSGGWQYPDTGGW